MASPLDNSHVPHRRRFPRSAMPGDQYGRSIDTSPKAQDSAGGAAAGGLIPPLWLTASDTTHLKVAFGQVNGITPSDGWAGGGDDVGVDVDISGYADGTYNIYIHCTLGSDGIPTAVEVLAATSAVPANDSGNSYRLIGTAVIAAAVAGLVSPSMAWSQEFVTCGRDAADPGTTPGTYFWELA